MKNLRIKDSFENTEKALKQLEKAIGENRNEFIQDSVIQRFEFSIELTWKLMKRILEDLKIKALSPKSVMQEAFIQGWIEEENLWLSMLDDRNLSSHTYNQDLAEKIYDRIKTTYYNELKKTFANLEKKYRN